MLWLGLAQATPMDAAGKCRIVAPAKAQTGTPYALRGTGFAVNSAIAISLKGGGTTVNVSVQSDAKGRFSLLLGAASGEQGRYTVTAQGGKGKTRCVAKAAYTVAIGPVPSPTPTLPPLPDPAPPTGISLPTLAIAGAVAALVWAVFVVAALARLRRRRSAE
jgi:CO/xanthine dehydrogenase Mo-binding subunit